MSLQDRPPFVTLRLTSPRMEHPAVKWLQELCNERSPKYVRPPLELDGVFGAQTAAECEEMLYRLGHPNPIPAIGPQDLKVLWEWSQDKALPTDWQARRLARMAKGFRRGWGITFRSWRALHPGQYATSPYSPAAAADLMKDWAEAGWKEVPPGGNVVPAMVALARSLEVRSDVSGMGYPWCQFAVYLAALKVGGKTAKAGLVDKAFWPLYTPFTLEFGRKRQYGHAEVSRASARKGDIVLFNFGSRDPVQHSGRLLEPPGQLVVTVDGNTSVTSEDNGGAMMVRSRSASTVVAYVRDS